MAIRTHRRRKIHIDGRDFVWHANDEWTMHVASVDKRFVASIPIVFPPFPLWDEVAVDHLPILVSGPEFPGLDGQKDVWVRCPIFKKHDLGSTPGSVRKLVLWCLDPNKGVEVIGPLVARKDRQVGRALE